MGEESRADSNQTVQVPKYLAQRNLEKMALLLENGVLQLSYLWETLKIDNPPIIKIWYYLEETAEAFEQIKKFHQKNLKCLNNENKMLLGRFYLDIADKTILGKRFFEDGKRGIQKIQRENNNIESLEFDFHFNDLSTPSFILTQTHQNQRLKFQFSKTNKVFSCLLGYTKSQLLKLSPLELIESPKKRRSQVTHEFKKIFKLTEQKKILKNVLIPFRKSNGYLLLGSYDFRLFKGLDGEEFLTGFLMISNISKPVSHILVDTKGKIINFNSTTNSLFPNLCHRHSQKFKFKVRVNSSETKKRGKVDSIYELLNFKQTRLRDLKNTVFHLQRKVIEKEDNDQSTFRKSVVSQSKPDEPFFRVKSQSSFLFRDKLILLIIEKNETIQDQKISATNILNSKFGSRTKTLGIKKEFYFKIGLNPKNGLLSYEGGTAVDKAEHDKFYIKTIRDTVNNKARRVNPLLSQEEMKIDYSKGIRVRRLREGILTEIYEESENSFQSSVELVQNTKKQAYQGNNKLLSRFQSKSELKVIKENGNNTPESRFKENKPSRWLILLQILLIFNFIWTLAFQLLSKLRFF